MVKKRMKQYNNNNNNNVNNDEQCKNKPQSSSWYKVCMFFTICVVVAIAIIIAVPGPIDAIVIELEPYEDEFDNNNLQAAVKLFEGDTIGPEGFAIDSNGNMYTGLADGRIIMFNDTGYVTVARMGQPPYDKCGSLIHESRCGRPLGIESDPSNTDMLYIAESYHGIYQLNLVTKDIKLIVNVRDTPSYIPKIMFVNDLVVLKNGSIFFTDSSSLYSRNEVMKEVYAGRSTGKLLHYNPNDKSLSLVLSGMTFANGLYVNGNEDYLLISETTTCRIIKYHLSGPKAGTIEPFISNLPGLPDNISPSSSGGIWVGFATSRRSGMIDLFASLPSIRNLVVKLRLEVIMYPYLPKDGMIIEYNEKGDKIRGLYDLNGHTIEGVSEVLDKGKTLYLGSYRAPYLARLDLL